MTSKAEPEDIDLIVVLRADFDQKAELRPFQYNIKSKRMVRQKFKFDILVTKDGTHVYHEFVGLFASVKMEHQVLFGFPSRKGLLRVKL